MRDERAFTVVELSVALAVLALLAGTAVLEGRRALAGWRLNAAARQVVMDLKLARALAMEESVTHRVRFPAPGATYRHERRRPSGGYEAIAPPTGLPSDVTVIDCSGPGSGISFRPRGNAGAFGTVVLRNSEGAERAVVVDIVGRVRVQ